MKKAIAYLFPVIIWMLLIFYVSSLSHPPRAVSLGEKKNVLPVDVVYHFTMFCVLAVLVYRALVAYDMRNPMVVALVLVLLYAVSDETHQLFVPFRVFDWRDVRTDMLGAVMICSRHMPRLLRRQRK